MNAASIKLTDLLQGDSGQAQTLKAEQPTEQGRVAYRQVAAGDNPPELPARDLDLVASRVAGCRRDTSQGRQCHANGPAAKSPDADF